MTTAEGLLDITLSNGTKYSTSNNPSTADKPIELPALNQSLADVKMMLPAPKSSITLNELVSSPYNYWGDDNGDGKGENGVTAIGNMSMTVTDIWGQSVNRDVVLSVCNSPYKVILSTTAGSLTTQYGTPNRTDITAASETYYIRPKVDKPIACWAEPNLDYSSTHKHPKPEAPWATFIGVDGPASQWNPDRGFILQSLNNPSANFPTMGSYGLFFNLIVGNGIGKNVTYSKSPASSSIDLTITDAGSNVAKIMLTGPRNGATPAQAQTAVPTTFTIYSDTAKTNAIYSFTISKWFIAKPGNGGGWDENFCHNTYGGSYRTPNIVELSNANSHVWTGGLTGQSTTYQRRIGGGLFAEWGNMENLGTNGKPSIYQQSDFDNVWYWAAEGYDTYNHRYVDSYGGWVSIGDIPDPKYRFVCVTP